MDTVHECDGQTDRITITKTVQRIASHGKNQAYVRVKVSTFLNHMLILWPRFDNRISFWKQNLTAL